MIKKVEEKKVETLWHKFLSFFALTDISTTDVHWIAFHICHLRDFSRVRLDKIL